MSSYRLSHQAEQDLLGIALFGIEQFGIEQSFLYRDKLEKHLSDLAESPLAYPAVDHIRKGYRRSVCGSHSIYYLIEKDFIEIIRVIGREDFH